MTTTSSFLSRFGTLLLPVVLSPSASLVFIAKSFPQKISKEVLLQLTLRTFDDAKISFRARTERLKRPLVSLALAGCQRGVIAVEFDNNRPQQPSVVTCGV